MMIPTPDQIHHAQVDVFMRVYGNPLFLMCLCAAGVYCYYYVGLLARVCRWARRHAQTRDDT